MTDPNPAAIWYGLGVLKLGALGLIAFILFVLFVGGK